MENRFEHADVLAAWNWGGEVAGALPYGEGHINATHCIYVQLPDGDSRRYILQKINTATFTDPDGLMKNICGVNEYLRKQAAQRGEDPARVTLQVIPTVDGKVYLGKVRFILGAVVGTKADGVAEVVGGQTRHNGVQVNDAESLAGFLVEQDVVQLGVVVGHPQGQFSGSQQIGHVGTIRFAGAHKGDLVGHVFGTAHHVGSQGFLKVFKAAGRVVEVGNGFVQGGGGIAGQLLLEVAKGHGTLVEIFRRLDLLQAAGDAFTPLEKETLPWGAKLMTLECGIRFLTDYLEGDHYFHTTRPGQNLDRARTQFKLVQDMEGCWDQMEAIVKKYC